MLNSKYNVKQKGGSSERVEKIVYGLLKKNVKLLALDFDQTLVDIFMSTYQSSPSLIAQHIRPVFVSLINACMAKNIWALNVQLFLLIQKEKSRKSGAR